jgi:hypothetical protein
MATFQRIDRFLHARRAEATGKARSARPVHDALLLVAGLSQLLGCGLDAAPRAKDDADSLSEMSIERGYDWGARALDPLGFIVDDANADGADDGDGDAASGDRDADRAWSNDHRASDDRIPGASIGSGGPRSSSASPPSADPIAFLTIDQRLSIIAADLALIDNQADRARVRYIDFSNLSNTGLTGIAIEPYRQAVSLMINSLSKGDAIVGLRSVDEDGLLYALDLRDYGWDSDTWESIIDEYPYGVSYQQDSRLLPYDENTAAIIREATATAIPYVQGDWFLAHASSAPLYYEILDIPQNLLELAAELGVDVVQNIRDQQVVRAGFNRSEVALNNRIIERHELPGSGGALWLTYDFKDSVDERNVFAHPLDFEQDASEGIFTLPNGLQGYFLGNAAFSRQNKLATDIATDPHSRDRAVVASVSCMGGCHLARGIELKDDEVRSYVALVAADARTIDQTLAIYPPREQMAAFVRADSERYLDAVRATGFALSDENAINELVRSHQDTLGIAGVAAVLGIKESTLDKAMIASPQVFPPEILTLRDRGAVIHRETLDAIFPDVVEGLGLGAQIQP